MECKVLRCTCQSVAQDELYGRQMRLCNPTGKGGVKGKFRCTVCNKEL